MELGKFHREGGFRVWEVEGQGSGQDHHKSRLWEMPGRACIEEKSVNQRSDISFLQIFMNCSWPPSSWCEAESCNIARMIGSGQWGLPSPNVCIWIGVLTAQQNLMGIKTVVHFGIWYWELQFNIVVNICPASTDLKVALKLIILNGC